MDYGKYRAGSRALVKIYDILMIYDRDTRITFPVQMLESANETFSLLKEQAANYLNTFYLDWKERQSYRIPSIIRYGHSAEIYDDDHEYDRALHVKRRKANWEYYWDWPE